MSVTDKKIKRIIVFGLVYLIIGIISALISNPIELDLIQTVLRLIALFIGAVVLVVQIRMEIIQLLNSPRKAALNSALAVALGTFLLAVTANIYAILNETGNKNSLLLALVAWPLVTGLLSFLFAYILAKIIARNSRSGTVVP